MSNPFFPLGAKARVPGHNMHRGGDVPTLVVFPRFGFVVNFSAMPSSHRSSTPAVSCQLRGGALSPRWYPHGSHGLRSTSFRCKFSEFLPCVTNLFTMAAFHRGGFPTPCGRPHFVVSFVLTPQQFEANSVGMAFGSVHGVLSCLLQGWNLPVPLVRCCYLTFVPVLHAAGGSVHV